MNHPNLNKWHWIVIVVESVSNAGRNRTFVLLPFGNDGLTFQSIKIIKMKAVVIGEPSGASLEAIMVVYPRHKIIVDKYVAQGALIGVGPFGDLGNMAIFKTRAAAEQFVLEDPFILEGLVKSFVIRDWKDNMLLG